MIICHICASAQMFYMAKLIVSCVIQFPSPLSHGSNPYISLFREFLVDLMGAPGTLIPADILNAKDSSLQSYNPKLSKIPTLQAPKDSGAVYSRPKPLLDDYEGSSQTSTIENSSLPDKKASSEKTESLDSLSTSYLDTGVATPVISKRVIPVNQSDLRPSSGIGASVCKGSRVVNVVGDGLRMNVNIVPYDQNGAEDPKNLFADLNPFQMIGPSKASSQSKPTEKVDGFQGQKNSAAPGRPPLPLIWKNRYAYNEVPRKKENDFVEGLFPRVNRESNDYNLSSLTSNNATTSDKIYSGVLKLSGNADLNNKVNDDKKSSCNTNSTLAPSASQLNRLSLNEDVSTNYHQEYHKNGTVFQNDMVNVAKEHDKHKTGLPDCEKLTPGSCINNSLREAESPPCSSVDSGAGKVDQMFEDVGECEIPWEDLVLGDRIGLGNINDWPKLFVLWMSCFKHILCWSIVHATLNLPGKSVILTISLGDFSFENQYLFLLSNALSLLLFFSFSFFWLLIGCNSLPTSPPLAPLSLIFNLLWEYVWYFQYTS